MRKFHKKYSTNDLYGLPKACQEALDLALTCLDAEQIIQKTTNPAMKARFQHVRKARVLSFEVDPYTDIDMAELPFSLEDLQYLRHHFEVFSVVSLFGLTVDEKDWVQSQTPETNGLKDYSQKEARSGYMSQEQVLIEAHGDQAKDALTHNAAVLDNPEDDD
ncbi:hypothetical protein COP2_023677 [Malus domestica]